MTKISILFCLCFLSTFVYSQENSAQISIKDYLLKDDNKDFQFLDETIKDVQILAIGESTHGTKEFNLIYLKMFKYLVEEHNFTTLFLEDEYSRCLILDQYIKCEENCDSVSVGVLGKWPWMTNEMNDLIEWIKIYNVSTDKEKLSIVGIDIQDSQHICLSLNQLLQTSNQDTLLLPSKKESFTERQHAKQIKKYSSAEFIDFYKGKLSSIENSSRITYSKLIDVLEWNQLMNKKPRKLIRDLAMGKNILSHLESFPSTKGMFIAHNDHIAKLSDGKKNEFKSMTFAGGVVEKNLGEKYFSIMQEFDEGCFNAYSLKPTNKKKIGRRNTKNYDLGKVCIEKSIENSIGSILRNKETEILYISGSDFLKLTPLKDIRYHNIGGLFVADKKNSNQTRQFFFLPRDGKWYDAIIFHRQSTPTTLVGN